MKTIYISLFLVLAITGLYAQIWEPKNIDFPIASQGWRIKPVSENVVWTFGYSIGPDSLGYTFTSEERTVERSVDGGNAWESITFKLFPEDGGFICDVFALNDKTAYVSYFDNTKGDVLYYTKDGGQSWQADYSLATYFLNWVYFYDEFKGVGFADANDDGYFEFLSTENGGTTWELNDPSHSILAEDDFGITGIYAASGNHLWTITSSDRIFHSSDKGKNWESIPPADNATGNFWGIVADHENTLFTVYNDFDNNRFSIYAKKVNELDWQDVTPQNDLGYVPGLSAVPGTSSLVCNVADASGDPSTFKTLISLNSGKTWSQVSGGEGFKYGFVEFYNDNTGYACEIPTSYSEPTDNIFKYNGTPLTGILNQKPLNVTFDLFPIPCADVINISVKTDNAYDFWILINDVNGKLINKKVMTEQKEFSTSFVTANLPTGEYIVTISNKHGSISKKIFKN